MNWLLIGVVALNLTFSTIGDICSKLWGTTDSNGWFYIGFAINLLTMFLFMLIVRIGGLGITTAIVLVLTILLNVGFGHFMFHERIDSIQWVGVGVAVLAILLLLNVFKPAS